MPSRQGYISITDKVNLVIFIIIINDLLHWVSFFSTSFRNSEGKTLNYFPELFKKPNPVPVCSGGFLHEGYRTGRKKKAPLRTLNRRSANPHEGGGSSACSSSVWAAALSSPSPAFVARLKNFKAFHLSPTIIWTHLSIFHIAAFWEPLLLWWKNTLFF